MGPSLKGVSNRTSCQEKGKYDLDWETDLDEYHTPGVGHYAEVDVVESVIMLSRHWTADAKMTAERSPTIGYYAWVQRTLEDIGKAFAACQHEWETSSAKTLLEDQIARITKDTHITKVVTFALGSFQEVYHIQRYRSNIQLAALITMLECINKGRDDSSQHAECFIQDPHFSKNDQRFLSTHGITVVDDPEGFNRIDSTTLVYMVRAYEDIYRVISEGPSRPAVLICDRLDGMVRSHDRALSPEGLPYSKYVMGINREEAINIEQMAAEYEQEDFPQMPEDFPQLPEEEYRPFRETCIYSRRHETDDNSDKHTKV